MNQKKVPTWSNSKLSFEEWQKQLQESFAQGRCNRKWPSERVWRDYGIKHKYNTKTRSELVKLDGGFTTTGYGHGWMKNFPIKETASRWTKEKWLDIAVENQYNLLTKTQVAKKAPTFMAVGQYHDWIQYFKFKAPYTN